ncbi:uncharacterized protein LOC108737911 [Agrilus planipennis]|uniref:Uncharacterized protein LOC108737911 n=1 Tax=Agrilus planipennis TaxID=224129 RepID=A0A1W4X1E4_AGRPL|nr:uncharacterized protein LOC108737911 [Agrilus planipennis]
MVRSKVRNLGDLLKHTLGEVEVLEEKYKFLTDPGEHYGSIMLAVDVTVKKPGETKEEVLYLVAKILPASEMLRVVFDVSVTFKKEINAYLNAVPAILRFQKDNNVPKEHEFDIFPKCYGARLSLDKNKDSVDDDAAIIFDNLKSYGYEMGDRLVGFDLAHAELIVRDLAKFHAVPLALRLKRPDVFEEKILPCTTKNKTFDQFPEDAKKAFNDSIIDGVNQVQELEVYLPRIQAAINKAMTVPPNPPKDPFITVIHSDYWVNNTMVLKDITGKPVKNKIVDLQLITLDSPIKDLIFFLFTSVINDVLDKNFDRLVRIYYENFLDNLKDYGIDIGLFSWDVFEEELNRVAKEEFYHVAVMLKPIFTERGKVQHSLEDFQPSDWTRDDLLGPRHTKKMKDTVLAFAKHKWI